jgi:hypothetical protein
MKIKYLLLILPILLIGCSSMNSYQEPTTGSQPLATVKGSSTRDGLFVWSNLNVTSIDNKQVGMVWSENSNINVVPGPHLFVISSTFNQGFGSGPYNSITEVYATLKPGMQYRFVGKPYGASMNVWAEDSRGQRVSGVGSSNYQYSPQPSHISTVIYKKK